MILPGGAGIATCDVSGSIHPDHVRLPRKVYPHVGADHASNPKQAAADTLRIDGVGGTWGLSAIVTHEGSPGRILKGALKPPGTTTEHAATLDLKTNAAASARAVIASPKRPGGGQTPPEGADRPAPSASAALREPTESAALIESCVGVHGHRPPPALDVRLFHSSPLSVRRDGPSLARPTSRRSPQNDTIKGDSAMIQSSVEQPATQDLLRTGFQEFLR